MANSYKAVASSIDSKVDHVLVPGHPSHFIAGHNSEREVEAVD